MVGWHHRLDGHEFEQALGVGEGRGSLACCSPWGRKESDTTGRLDSRSREVLTAVWACSSCSAQLLTVGALLVAERGLQGALRLQQLWLAASVVPAHGLQSAG